MIGVIGGTSEFVEIEPALKKIAQAFKKQGINVKDIRLVYGYGNKGGAYDVAVSWAEKNDTKFREGSPKFHEFRGLENGNDLATESRNNILSECAAFLCVLKKNFNTGGNGIIKAFEDKGKPVIIIDTAVEEEKFIKPTARQLKDSVKRVSKLAQTLLENSVMLDTETTGLSKKDEVIELAIAECKTGKILFNELLYSDIESNPKAFELNGITREMLEGKKKLSEVYSKIEKLIGGRIVLASNSSFDERLIGQSIAPNTVKLQFLDILPLYRKYSAQEGRKSLNTAKICEQLGITEGGHRALGDVIAQVAIVKAMASAQLPVISD